MQKPESKFRIGDKSKKNFTMLPNTIVRKRWPRGFKEILLSIASHAGDGGVCTCSAATLAAESGVKRDTVYAAIAFWRDKGVIEVELGKHGKPPEIITAFDYTSEYPQVSPERDTQSIHTRPPGGTGGVPHEGHLPVPLEGHKEESLKKNPEEDYGRAGDKYIFRGRKRRYGPNEGMQPIGKLLEKHRRP